MNAYAKNSRPLRLTSKFNLRKSTWGQIVLVAAGLGNLFVYNFIL
jgi:hypothetical protein